MVPISCKASYALEVSKDLGGRIWSTHGSAINSATSSSFSCCSKRVIQINVLEKKKKLKHTFWYLLNILYNFYYLYLLRITNICHKKSKKKNKKVHNKEYTKTNSVANFFLLLLVTRFWKKQRNLSKSIMKLLRGVSNFLTIIF